jgi:predicted permease
MSWHRLFRRRDYETELEKELRFHLDQHASDLVDRGVSPEEARRQARVALGGPEYVKEMCRDATEQDGRYRDVTDGLLYGGALALFVSGLVLLLTCANVANMLLARATTRAKEIGIRLAIGAGPGRVVQQLLTESVMLALLGGAIGLLFAYWSGGLVAAATPPVPYPLAFDFTPDTRVVRWMLAVAGVTGVVFGLAPALLASRADLTAVIKGAAERPTRGRRWSLGTALVVAQVTISIVVLVCAGLFVRSLGEVRRTDPGFRTENLVTMMVNPGLLAYEREASRRFYPELRRRVEALPGVRAAALVDEMPLMVGQTSRGPVVKEGDPEPPPNRGVEVDCSFVTPGFFDAMQTPLVLGRDFVEHDDAGAPPVVVVNQEFARRFYGSEADAIGKRFRAGRDEPPMEIVAVVKDGRYRSLYEEPRTHIFLPVYQNPRTAMTLLVRAESAATVGAATEGARREIAGLDARLPVVGVMTADENLSLAYWGPRVAAGMATSFGALALLLATTGLYGVMAFTVSQRTREIGIRMALGAAVGDVLRLVVGQGMRIALLGVVFGLAGALAVAQLLTSLLNVGATDPSTFAGVAALLIGVTFLACYVPARRATRVDPLIALRHD